MLLLWGNWQPVGRRNLTPEQTALDEEDAIILLWWWYITGAHYAE